MSYVMTADISALPEVIEPWDRPLTSDEIFRLSPANSAKRARLSLMRKVARLELAAVTKNGLQLISYEDYRSRAALRRWTDESLKLWPWSYRPVDDPLGNNSDLMDRYDTVLVKLKTLALGLEVSWEDQLAEKDKYIANLEKQVFSLMAQLEKVMQHVPAERSI